MDELLRIDDIELNSYDSQRIKDNIERLHQRKMTMEEVAEYLLSYGKPFVKQEMITPFVNQVGDKLDFVSSVEFTLIFIQDNEKTDLEFELHPHEENGEYIVYKRYIPKDEEEIRRLVEKFKSELPNIVADFIVKNCHDVNDHVMKQTYEILKKKYMYKEEKFQ